MIFIVAPDGQAGGGMGRVKDYILDEGASSNIGFVPLITRDNKGFLQSLLLTLKAVFTIWKFKWRGQLDLVHVNMGDKASVLRKGLVTVFCRIIGVKVVLHLHAVELDTLYARSGPFLRLLIGLPFKAATVIVVLGRVYLDWLVQELEIPAHKIETLTNGVPVDHHEPKPSEKTLGVLFLGNLIERKGVDLLLKAVAALPDDTLPWTLTLAGGGDLARYKQIVRHLGLEQKVHFTGWLDQAAAQQLLRHSDILVLPSYHEGLPLVILEALGCGTVVVCTPVGAVPEVLTDGHDAIFCKIGDFSDLTGCLLKLLRQPDLRMELKKNGMSSYDKRFSLQSFSQNLFRIYKKHCGVNVERSGVQCD